jgi:hypothetical protein
LSGLLTDSTGYQYVAPGLNKKYGVVFSHQPKSIHDESYIAGTRELLKFGKVFLNHNKTCFL